MKRYPWPWSSIEKRTFARAPWAIAGNAEGADVLRRRGYTGEVRVIPQFGVDPEVFRPRPGDPAVEALRTRLGLPARGVIGYVGRLVREKGVLELLEAFASVAASGPRVHAGGTPPSVAPREGPALLLLGGGPLRREIERRAGGAALRGRVRVLDAVPSTLVPLHMNLLDLLVLPSRTTPRWKEQFGRVLVEAMASGVPVLGSDSGEIPRVIGGAGTVFREGDVRAMGEAILRRLGEIAGADRDSAAAQGEEPGGGPRAAALARFSNDRIVGETVRFYREIAAARAGGAR
jgi:glycosyltransferase involved in cell wall biosynthesis